MLMLVTDVREATATEQNDLKRQNVLMLVTPKRVYPLHVRECYTFCILYYTISCYMYTSAVTKSISLPAAIGGQPAILDAFGLKIARVYDAELHMLI